MDTTHHSSLTIHHLRSRDGVVLLVILGMLAALALIGITFTTFSAQEENSSASFKTNFQTPRGDLDWTVIVNEALAQLVADTDNPHSALRGHSLLRDMYGNNNDTGLGPDGRPGKAGTDDNGDGVTDDLSELGWPGSDDAPNGVVDVFESYRSAFDGIGELGLDGILGTVDDVQVNYVYNGRRPEYVFDATISRWVRGPGADEDYDYPDHNNIFLAAIRADGTVLVPSYYRPGYLSTANGNWTNAAGRMSILRPRAWGPGPDGKPGQSGVDDDNNGVVDDASERLWPGSDDTGEHRFFGPGNLTTSGIYDVDNMGLGRTDSVWLDIGFPVQETLKGRRFKPLVALVVMDVDGKLNLNVHGNLTYDKINAAGTWVYPDFGGDGTPDSHSDIAPGAGQSGMAHSTGSMSPPTGAILVDPTSATNPWYGDLPMGRGWTVNEVNLQNPFNPLFASLVPSGGSFLVNEYRWLLEGQQRAGPDGTLGTSDDVFVPGRWGEPSLIGTATRPRAGATYAGSGPVVYSDDNTPGYRRIRGNITEGRRNSATGGGLYRQPADFDGNGVLALDRTFPDRPFYGPAHPRLGWGGSLAALGLGWPASYGHQVWPENLDEAAECNPYLADHTDARYLPRELELLYRYEDVDGTSLIQSFSGPSASRLPMLAASLFDLSNGLNRRRRFMLTTESWDLARPNMAPQFPWEKLGTAAAGRGNGVFPFSDPRTETAGSLAFYTALPEAIRNGRRLQLNPEFPPAVTPTLDPTDKVLLDKQRFARELYLVMRAISPLSTGTLVPSTTEDFIRIRRMAQFCINVVDFCDAERGNDEVMTPFVYDIDPSHDLNSDGNGWDVATDPTIIPDTRREAAERGVVWGTEAPRLVINEILAYREPNGTYKMWVELYNPSPYAVELNGTNQNYQLIVSDRLPQDCTDPAGREGEPNPNATMYDTRLFNAGSGPTSIAAGDRLVVGPAGSIPAVLGGGPTGSVFVPSAPFAPTGTGEFRVYLRRLANTSQSNDEGIGFPYSRNPYITVDALNGWCHVETDTVDDGMGNVKAKSFERRSLGVLTEPLAPPSAGGAAPRHSMGDVNSPTALDFDGDGTADNWPWLVFNDRPLASPMELLLVPGVGPQHLTTTFFYPTRSMAATNLDPYKPTTPNSYTSTTILTGDPPCRPTALAAAPIPPDQSPFLEPPGTYLFGHLLNFFRDATVAGTAAPVPGYYRLFEFVEVPSRVNGSRDPTIPSDSSNPSGAALRDRVPGKININTMWEQEIFQALCNNHPATLESTAFIPPPETATMPAGKWLWGHSLPLGTPAVTMNGTPPVSAEMWRRFLYSVANPTTADGGTGDGVLFTRDDRPFRSFSFGTAGTPPSGTYVPGIQSTLLRGLGAAGSAHPIFADTRGEGAMAVANPPPGLAGAADKPANALDYPNFRLEVLEKISNLVTTRSNVYAVWMTVGFFEVGNEDPNRLVRFPPGDPKNVYNAPPELGAEMDLDIGRNVRHRAFFIIDRSQARGYAGPPRNSKEVQDIMGQVLIHSRIIE